MLIKICIVDVDIRNTISTDLRYCGCRHPQLIFFFLFILNFFVVWFVIHLIQ